MSQDKPKEKVYTLSDRGGLQLRIKPNGSKLWLLDYSRSFTKKRTSLSFGTYPALSLADAHRHAFIFYESELVALLSHGPDRNQKVVTPQVWAQFNHYIEAA